MSKADGWENGLLLLVFNNVTYTLLGDAAGILKSVGDGDIFVSLHTTPGPVETSDQTTNETSYGAPYARIGVSRTGTTGWTVTNNSVSPTADIDFIECTATPGTDLTHFGCGTDVSGVGKLLYYGTLTPNIVMNVGVIPRVKTTSTITED